MLKSNRKSNYCQLRDRVNHHNKFCFDTSSTNHFNAEHVNFSCSTKLLCKFYEGKFNL